MTWLATFWIVVVVAALFVAGLRWSTLMEYERGVWYFCGRFDRVVGPGMHVYAPLFVRLERVDMRRQHVSIAGQEVLSADGVALKVSLAVNYEVADPEVALNKSKDYAGALHLELQIAVREIIGGGDVDTLLGQRETLGARMLEKCVPRAAALGVRLISVDVKDIMVPGKLKEMFAQVVAARKAGLAALEKARGETAALRHLSNAARLVDDQPNLLQLRLLHALTESSGHTVILNAPSQATVIPVRSSGASRNQTLPPAAENPSGS